MRLLVFLFTGPFDGRFARLLPFPLESFATDEPMLLSRNDRWEMG